MGIKNWGKRNKWIKRKIKIKLNKRKLVAQKNNKILSLLIYLSKVKISNNSKNKPNKLQSKK